MAAVPTISNAQIQAVADPQVRAILRALADASAVRSGDVGDGTKAFLTREDLMNGGETARAVAMALARPIATAVAGGGPNTDLTPLGTALEQRIIASPAWQQMFTRLELISAPDSLPGSFASQLLTEAKARNAAVTTVSTAVQKANESIATTKTELTAAIGDNAAAIAREEQVRATATDALAQSQQAYIASTNKTVAGLQNDIQVKTNSDNALAQALNTLWTRIGANTALVQTGSEITANNVGSVVTKFEQLQAVTTDPVTGLVAKYTALRTDYSAINDKVSGMAAKWSVKLDLNGYISGLSLNAGVTPDGKSESSFIIAADVFAIGAPGKPNLVPFALDAKTGLLALKGSIIATGTIQGAALVAKSITADSGVIGDLAVRTANIDNAAITTAKIGDASVETLKIAGNAVTAMASAQGIRECNITINAMGVPIMLLGASSAAWNDIPEAGWVSTGMFIYRDGVLLRSFVNSVLSGAHESGAIASSGVYVDYPPPGVHTYTFRSEGYGFNGGGPSYSALVNAALMETRR